jgi:hypothetical protein
MIVGQPGVYCEQYMQRTIRKSQRMLKTYNLDLEFNENNHAPPPQIRVAFSDGVGTQSDDVAVFKITIFWRNRDFFTPLTL